MVMLGQVTETICGGPNSKSGLQLLLPVPPASSNCGPRLPTVRAYTANSFLSSWTASLNRWVNNTRNISWRSVSVDFGGALAITSKRSVSSQGGPPLTLSPSMSQAVRMRSTMVALRI